MSLGAIKIGRNLRANHNQFCQERSFIFVPQLKALLYWRAPVQWSKFLTTAGYSFVFLLTLDRALHIFPTCTRLVLASIISIIPASPANTHCNLIINLSASTAERTDTPCTWTSRSVLRAFSLCRAAHTLLNTLRKPMSQGTVYKPYPETLQQLWCFKIEPYRHTEWIHIP